MLLQKVVYELFGWEAEGAYALKGMEELHRQVRLEGPDESRVYISWAWGKGQPDYFVDQATASFFTDQAEMERDVSGSPVWQALIGRAITVGYRDHSWQVIEVRSGDIVVYCASFQHDSVFVMTELRSPRE
jgi:hypothetical protein